MELFREPGIPPSNDDLRKITIILLEHQKSFAREKINTKVERKLQPDGYPYTLVYFQGEYYNKKPHPKRQEITGTMAKLSISDMKFILSDRGLIYQRTDKFIKCVKVLPRYSLEQAVTSALETRRMYPNTQFQVHKDKVLIMMDNLPGQDLSITIASGDFEQVDVLARHQIAWELYAQCQFLQLHGIVHCDIKLENILLSLVPLLVSLIDFDFAVYAKNSACTRGTMLYFAPELLHGGTVNTFASDIYAFGLCLFFIYGGKNAYDDLSDRLNEEVDQSSQDTVRLDYLRFLTEQFNAEYIAQFIAPELKMMASFIAALCHCDLTIRKHAMDNFTTIFCNLTHSTPLKSLQSPVVIPTGVRPGDNSCSRLCSSRTMQGLKNHGLFPLSPAKTSAFAPVVKRITHVADWPYYDKRERMRLPVNDATSFGGICNVVPTKI